MKISKATREAAANLCSAMASWWEATGPRYFPEISELDAMFGVEARKLAIESKLRNPWFIEDLVADRWRMAEAIIRDGWTP